MLIFFSVSGFAQLSVARDTITVFENGKVLKMPWANGFNSSNVSSIDLNNDGKKDLVLFDRVNQFSTGRFRCFIKEGNNGQPSYRPDLQLSYHFPTVTGWAVLLDYDCDGKEDLFCSTSAGIKVYRNTSNGNYLTFTVAKNLLYSDYDPTGQVYLANLYASSVGVPGISDIDGDGDLDILTFAVGGYFVQYHKNMSMERYSKCDSLEFEIGDFCWGKLYENNCTVTFDMDCQQKLLPDTTGKVYHAGSCLTCLDSDADGDKDLIMGDIACNTVNYVHNSGTFSVAAFADTTSMYPNYPALSNTTRLKLNNFPCTYYLDADGDSKKDLLASPNAFGSENFKSLWYYQNVSSTGTVNFQFVKNNFLQDEMIEVGQSAYPVLFDFNGDSKKDLLVGTHGYYVAGNLESKLTLYENIGTTTVPVFSLVTRDYGGLKAKSLSNIMPATGDVDGDGDVDILVGTSTGQVHWLENTAGAGNVANYSVFKTNPFTFTTSSAVAAPQLFDIDADGKLDLLIGTKNGRVAYYKNIGSATAPSFSLITNSLGGIDVKGNPNLYGLDGYAVPYFYTDNTGTKCMVGSVSGEIFHYSVPANLTQPFTQLSSAISGLNEGGQSTVWYEDLNADNKPDLFIGNGSGGLTYFSSNSPYVGLKETALPLKERFMIYPNPATQEVFLSTGAGELDEFSVTVFDVSGRKIADHVSMHNGSTINVSPLSPGIYFLKIISTANDGEKVFVKKLVKE